MSGADVAVTGAGTIGTGFALAFAAAGAAVRLWDPSAEQRERAAAILADRARALRDQGLVDEEAGAVASRVSIRPDLAQAVAGAALVQECVPEDLAVKREHFEAVAGLAPDAILASSTSALPPGRIGEGLACADRLIVAHPANPPYLLPVVELVPGPLTAAGTVEKAEAVYRAAGMRPVRLTREIEGFLLNRLQGAVLREAYCLVRDGYATVDDVDAVMRDGLGPRWAVIGPFETADLNAGGIEAHAARMGAAYARMGAERGQDDPWTEDLLAEVARQRRALLPAGKREARIAWRDRRLMRLMAARRMAEAEEE